MSRAESVLEAIYEDPDLRDNLTDDEAGVMIKWAEAELARLDAEQADDAAFEEAAEQLRRLLKGINRWIGHKGDPPEAQAAMMEKIGAAASGIGRALAAPVETLGSAQSAPDEMAMLQSILSRLSEGDVPASETAQTTPVEESVRISQALSAPPETGDVENHTFFSPRPQEEGAGVRASDFAPPGDNLPLEPPVPTETITGDIAPPPDRPEMPEPQGDVPLPPYAGDRSLTPPHEPPPDEIY
jgi:hypothetical protein